MSMKPKVSVIIPSLNVKKYIVKCLDSVLNQTLKDIEIICVDAGSDDGTLEIIKKYSKKYKNVHLIISQKKSYGYQMNLGIDNAKGEYIGIVESDDYIMEDMYNTLFSIAKEKNLDLVKSDYFAFTTSDAGERKEYIPLTLNERYYNKIINPRKDVTVFNLAMVTCTGLYNLAFLKENNIRYNETPGAAYQDNGFWHQTFYFSKKIYFLKQAFYCYRQDNEASSINNREKIFAGKIEYDYIYQILKKNQKISEIFLPIYTFRRYNNYIYNLKRISPEYHLDFLKTFQKDFLIAEKRGEIDWSLFPEKEIKLLKEILTSPESVYMEMNAVHVVFACNNVYAPYLNVALISLIEKCNENRKYVIKILHTSLSEENQRRLVALSKVNVSIECINTSKFLPQINLYKKHHFSEEMYFRILIPSIFSNQEKILYLDCDIVVNKDVALLFDTNMGNYPIAAVKNFCNFFMADYISNKIKLNPQQYFNSGVLLINLKEYRKLNLENLCFSLLSANQQFEYPDQDILNIACVGKVLWLKDNWNMVWQYSQNYETRLYNDENKYRYHNAAKEPYIIHFASGDKPWYLPERNWAFYFWEYARKSIYYEELISALVKKQKDEAVKRLERKVAELEEMEMYLEIEIKKIRSTFSYKIWEKSKWIKDNLVGGLQCCKDHGVLYTFHLFVKKVLAKMNK